MLQYCSTYIHVNINTHQLISSFGLSALQCTLPLNGVPCNLNGTIASIHLAEYMQHNVLCYGERDVHPYESAADRQTGSPE